MSIDYHATDCPGCTALRESVALGSGTTVTCYLAADADAVELAHASTGT